MTLVPRPAWALGALLMAVSAWGQFNTPALYDNAQKANKAVDKFLQGSSLSQEGVKRMKGRFIPGYYQSGGKGLNDEDLKQIVAFYQDLYDYREYYRQARPGGIDQKERAHLAELAQEGRGTIEQMANPQLKDFSGRLGQRLFGHGGGGVPGSGSETGGSSDWIDQALEKLRSGNAREALSDLDELLRQEPDNAAALTARGQIYADMGRMADANADARKALESDPSKADAYALYKLTEGRDNLPPPLKLPAEALDRDDEPEALGSAVSGLAKPNPAVDGALRTARERLAVGDRQAALASIEWALKADPANLNALRLRAYALARSGLYDAVLGAADAGLALHPRDVGLLNFKAFAKNKLKDYKGAMELAKLALEADPDNADALANLAYAYGGLGDRERMLSLLEQASRLNPAYRASLESARAMPPDSEVPFFFPWELSSGASAQPSDAERKGRSGRGRRFGVLLISSIIGGFLVALGLLQAVAAPLATRVRRAWTRSPALATGPAEPAETGEGGLLRGQYRLSRQIGMGGMGMVFEGADVSLNRPVAIKKMRDELRLDRRERLRFINEAKLVASLHHPNIVDIYAIIEQGDDIFLVFEYVSGKTVHDLVAGRGRLGFEKALGVCRGMTAALEFAHGRNVIHRDLKPSNVMVSDEGFVKVMDFGIARLAKDTAMRFSMTNTIMGTPPYMAPEQEQGVVRREGDVYSLAICVYEMLCGQPPFAGTGAGMLMNKVNMSYVPLSRTGGGLPAGVDEVFARAFQPDPEKRFRKAGDFLAALEALA